MIKKTIFGSRKASHLSFEAFCRTRHLENRLLGFTDAEIERAERIREREYGRDESSEQIKRDNHADR